MLINPRLTDYHGIAAPQDSIDFAIPFFNEDIPLYVDPFLLWRSPSQQDQALHTALINAFNHLGYLAQQGQREKAVSMLIIASECDEVGLGSSANRRGKRIGRDKAEEIIRLFDDIPRYKARGFRHFEEIQFFIDGVSKDRISDIACSYLKSFLIDFTISQCKSLGIPVQSHTIAYVYDYRLNEFKSEDRIELPSNPDTNQPIIFVPKRWLRHIPWLNFEDYFKNHCPQDDIAHEGKPLDRVDVLNFNRARYDVIEGYILEKERTFDDCRNDPLFSQIPVLSARRKLATIRKLPSGKTDNADIEYEKAIGELLPSLLYPHLDFAAVQSRTESGAVIRDLIFYNGQSDPFLKQIFDEYQSTQIVFELKNVAEVTRDHVNQLNRYMSDSLGKFGVLVTRNRLSNARLKSTVDLWSGQRRCIITLTDEDVEQMVELFESKQRLPLDVLKKKYVEYRRLCPG
ncbi:MAG TPA: hypothetical protein VHL98_14600 [Microvirga sp.]|nr:hypothetical protein [Microvirga sp.]